MTPQHLVDSHLSRTSAAVSRAVELLSVEAESVASHTSTYLSNNLRVRGGRAIQSAHNSSVLGAAPAEYLAAVRSSGYEAVAAAFTSTVVDQVGEVRDFLQCAGIDAPELDEDAVAVLADHASRAVQLLDAHVDRVGGNLARFLGRSMGGSEVGELVSGAMGVVRGVARVEPILLDHSLTFFRMSGNLAHELIEAGGTPLRYRYVGPETRRAFCGRLLGKLLSRAEVLALENGQTPGAAVGAGGWGCRHWWAAERL